MQKQRVAWQGGKHCICEQAALEISFGDTASTTPWITVSVEGDKAHIEEDLPSIWGDRLDTLREAWTHPDDHRDLFVGSYPAFLQWLLSGASPTDTSSTAAAGGGAGATLSSHRSQVPMSC